jgi:hypothetical protein
MNKEQIKKLAEMNATYTFDKATRQYGEFTDEYVRHFCNKLAELRGGIGDVHTCNCRRNSNSRDNEPCCRCDSKHTNADRIRNMSDEELADTLFNSCLEVMHIDECPYADNVGVCKKCILNWLKSEAE